MDKITNNQIEKEKFLKNWIKGKQRQILIQNGIHDISMRALDLTDEEYKEVEPYLKPLEASDESVQEFTTTPISGIFYCFATVFYIVSAINFYRYYDFAAPEYMLYALSGVISGTFFLGIGKIISLLNEINFKL